MGIFDKKFCCACGKKLGILGGKKLEDGSLCKDCENKLSPWFRERKTSTVSEILSQLDYRLANESDIMTFQTTRTLGDNMKVYLDDASGRFLVTNQSNLTKANPDVLSYDMVTNCTYRVNESKTELKQDGPDNTKISYDPPRYEYRYDFYVTIVVNHPYFSQIGFKVNPRSVSVLPQLKAVSGTETTTTTTARPAAPVRPPIPARPAAPAPKTTVTTSTTSQVVRYVPEYFPEENAEYIRYREMCEEICRALWGDRMGDTNYSV